MKHPVWTVRFQVAGKGGLYIFSRDGVATYDIPSKQCDTESKFRLWLTHLRDKNWFSAKLRQEFRTLWEARREARVH